MVWLLIPAALGLFVLRTVLIARKLKLTAQNPTAADLRALREAQRSLRVHREHLREAVAQPKEHLAAAKGLSRLPTLPSRSPAKGMDAIVEEFLPEHRL